MPQAETNPSRQLLPFAERDRLMGMWTISFSLRVTAGDPEHLIGKVLYISAVRDASRAVRGGKGTRDQKIIRVLRESQTSMLGTYLHGGGLLRTTGIEWSQKWLEEHPDSKAAAIVARGGLSTPFSAHEDFVSEMFEEWRLSSVGK